jgi:hypothetical protein
MNNARLVQNVKSPAEFFDENGSVSLAVMASLNNAIKELTPRA